MAGSVPVTRWLSALLATSLLLVVPDAAAARKVYINVELTEEYYASQPTGEHWDSAATFSAYYKTTSHALSAGDGNLLLTPAAVLGTFSAHLINPVPGSPYDCTWDGDPGGGHQLAELQDGMPFARELAIQWPGYPGMWQQVLSSSSTRNCSPVFSPNPLEGSVSWSVGNRTMSGGGNHFIYAAGPRNLGAELSNYSASVTSVRMSSLLDYADGESYTVTASGFIIESTVPYAGHKDVLPRPSISANGTLPAPLSVKALQKLGLKALPKKIPKGCVVGQRRRRHQRCP